MKRQIKSVLVIATLISTFVWGVRAGNLVETVQAEIRKDMTIIVDGENQVFQDANGSRVYPILYNGTTYLPVRAIGNLMGKNIGWNGETMTVTLSSAAYDLGGSLLYENSDIELRFKRTYKKEKNIYEEYGIELTLKNKSDKTIELYLESWAMNGISYSGMYSSDRVAPQSTGVIRFAEYVIGESGDYDLFPLSGIETVSGEFYYYPDDSYKSSHFTFSNIEIK